MVSSESWPEKWFLTPFFPDNESWSFTWTPDVRYGIERLYQAFQLHTHHLHPYELVVP